MMLEICVMNIQIGDRQLIPADRSLDISFNKCFSLSLFLNPATHQAYGLTKHLIQSASGTLLVINGADIITA